jgi:hypothetical protein
MTQNELKELKEQNKLVKELVLGIKQVIEGKTKPFN